MHGGSCHCNHVDALNQQMIHMGNGSATLQRMLSGPGGTDDRLRQATVELQRVGTELATLQAGHQPQAPRLLGQNGQWVGQQAQAPTPGAPTHNVQLDATGRLVDYAWMDRTE